MNPGRIRSALLYPCVLAAAVIVSCRASEPKTLTILHTNDMHASFIPHEAFWMKETPKPMTGGFAELGWTIDSIRKAKGDVLLLDAGDVMTGTPISDFEYHGAVGGGLFEMMNLIGYDAWEVGNHDLDISQENLRGLTHIAKFPTLSANLRDSLGGFPLNNRPCLTLKKNGLRIGIIGLMSKDLFQLTNTNNLAGLVVLPPAEVAQKLIDSLSTITDIIVALTHEGVDDDSALAATTHGINVIIGGHSHTRLKSPKVVDDVVICQTGSNCENLGELELTIQDHKVTAFNGKLIALWDRPGRPETEVSKFVREMKDKVDAEYGQVIGTLGADWRRGRSGETNIGEFVADAILEGTGADFAVTNSSGIRKDLPAGKITKLDLFEISPFRNVLCTFPVSGKDLRALVDRYVQSLASNRTSIDLSGIECRWKKVNGLPVMESCTVGGKPLSDESTYRCGTIDFVVNQGDKYLGFVPANVSYSKTLLYQALVEKVKKEKSVPGLLQHRVRESE